MSLKTDLENIASTSAFSLDVAAASKLISIKLKWDSGAYNGDHLTAMEDVENAWKMHSYDLSQSSSPNKEFWRNFHALGKGPSKFHYLCLESPPPA